MINVCRGEARRKNVAGVSFTTGWCHLSEKQYFYKGFAEFRWCQLTPTAPHSSAPERLLVLLVAWHKKSEHLSSNLKSVHIHQTLKFLCHARYLSLAAIPPCADWCSCLGGHLSVDMFGRIHGAEAILLLDMLALV